MERRTEDDGVRVLPAVVVDEVDEMTGWVLWRDGDVCRDAQGAPRHFTQRAYADWAVRLIPRKQ